MVSGYDTQVYVNAIPSGVTVGHIAAPADAVTAINKPSNQFTIPGDQTARYVAGAMRTSMGRMATS